MSFRGSLINEVIILEGLKKETLAKTIEDISKKHIIIDLQYTVSNKKLFSNYKHHAILLVQRKD